MSRPSNPPSLNILDLTAKLYDADSDLRYMSLSDLQLYFASPVYGSTMIQDYNACVKLVDGLLHTLNDPNGDVQNQTIKCIGSFVNKMHPTVLMPMIHKFAELEPVRNADTSGGDPSLSALAVRAIVVSLPRPSPGAARGKGVADAYQAISKVLIPKLVGYYVLPQSDKSLLPVPKGLLETELETGVDSNYIDVLTEVARCFGPMLQDEEIIALQKMALRCIESDRTSSVMKKKAVTALSTISHYFSNEMLSSLISGIIEYLRNPHLTPANRKLYITVLGSVAKAIPTKFGPHLRTLAPFVLSAVSQQELNNQKQDVEDEMERDPQLDEVREAALVALEAFIAYCGPEMERYMDECIDATLRFVKYDLLVVIDDEEVDADAEDMDAADDDFELDEDFEEEGGLDDEDDVSWKVRRCATKSLHTIISIRGRDLLENMNIYDRITQTLIARFKEREETVRLEVLSTLSFLIRKSGESEDRVLYRTNRTDNATAAAQQSRKRRRGYSDVAATENKRSERYTGSVSPEVSAPPRIGPAACLAKSGPEIVDGLLHLLKSSTTPTKLASTVALKEYVIARHGGLDDVMDSLIDLVIGAATANTSEFRTIAGPVLAGTGAANDTNLQIEALQLLGEILKAHSSKIFQAHLPKLVSVLTQMAQDRSPRIACEAMHTLEQMMKALTPPRSASTSQKTSALIEQMLNTTSEIISARNVDLSVRQQAIHVLATILGRTMGPQGAKLIQSVTKTRALELLYDTSKNETTRYASIRAINDLAIHAVDNKNGFDTQWLGRMSLELGQQLRKADRSLRGASLEALRTLLSERQGSRNLDSESSQQLASLLAPLLVNNDLHLLGPALIILAALVRDGNVVNDNLNKHICDLVITPTAASVIEQLCFLARSIGERGSGAPLMQALLKDVGISGSPTVVGKTIGNLLVSGMGNVGVGLPDFLRELEQAPDTRRKCLALSVLGEVGLRHGSRASEITPDLFMTYFSIKSDEVPLAAASALGRAAAGPGNVKSWVPAILARIRQRPEEQYLLLHSIRELLHQNEHDDDIVPFAGSLWDAANSAANTDNKRTIGAECIANLVMIEPVKFLPALQVSLTYTMHYTTDLIEKQSLLSDKSPAVRGIAILAFRDIFTVTDNTYEKDFRPVIIDALTTMMRDSEVENRRLSLNTFNAAARNKSELILPHLSSLMPLVVDHSHKDPSLIREVSMGPFKHTVDDGLEVRKV